MQQSEEDQERIAVIYKMEQFSSIDFHIILLFEGIINSRARKIVSRTVGLEFFIDACEQQIAAAAASGCARFYSVARFDHAATHIQINSIEFASSSLPRRLGTPSVLPLPLTSSLRPSMLTTACIKDLFCPSLTFFLFRSRS